MSVETLQRFDMFVKERIAEPNGVCLGFRIVRLHCKDTTCMVMLQVFSCFLSVLNDFFQQKAFIACKW